MRRNWIAILVLMVCALHTSSDPFETTRDPSKRKGSAPLFPVQYGKKWGFINRRGTVVISPQFETVGSFFNGLAWATLLRDGQRKLGYIDETGKFVIEPQFDEPMYGDAGDFLDNLAPARLGRKWGYIDRTGRWVVAPTFQAAGEFHEGLARVELWDQYPASGTAAFTKETAPDRLFPLLKDTWRREIDFPGTYIEGKFGFIDTLGRMVVQPKQFQMVEDFACGLAVFRLGAKRWGYIDRKGSVAFNKLFDYAKSFSEGLACVTVNALTGFIDSSGEFVVRPQYGASRSFSEGIAVVTGARIQPQEDSWSAGGIDKSGAVVVPFRFHDISDFSDGLAIANSGAGNFFINRQGKRVQITSLRINWSGFENGLAIVGEEGRRVYIDKDGNVVAHFEENPG